MKKEKISVGDMALLPMSRDRLHFKVKVLDIKIKFGKTYYSVSPVEGTGKISVEKLKVIKSL